MLTKPLSCLFVVVLGLCLAQPAAAGLEDSRWLHVQSENFELYSQFNRRKSVELVERLEMFRTAVSAITGTRFAPDPVPTRIVAFSNAAPWAHLSAGRAGVFTSSLRSNYMMLRETGSMDEASVLFHEYVHYLLRNNHSVRYPRWYEEGFAEYLSSTRLKGKQFQVGLFLESRVGNFRHSGWIAAEDVLTGNGSQRWHRERQSMFYAQSWAMVHYLLNQQFEEQNFTQRMAAYLHGLQTGVDHAEAFESAFELAVSEVNATVQNYLQRGRFPFVSFEARTLLSPDKPTVSRMTQPQAALLLAQVALSHSAFDRADTWFAIAREDAQLKDAADQGLAEVLLGRDQHSDAYAALASLIDRGIDTPEVCLSAALAITDTFEVNDVGLAEADSAAEQIEAAQEHLVQAWKLDNNRPETYYRLGISILAAGNDPARAVEMLVAAERLLPANLDIKARLALAHEQNQEPAKAVELASVVLAWMHAESDAAKIAEGVLTRLGAH